MTLLKRIHISFSHSLIHSYEFWARIGAFFTLSAWSNNFYHSKLGTQVPDESGFQASGIKNPFEY